MVMVFEWVSCDGLGGFPVVYNVHSIPELSFFGFLDRIVLLMCIRAANSFIRSRYKV